MPNAEGFQTSATQCHCINAECGKAEGFQRHPCGRCVKEGTVYLHAKSPELWVCQACADFSDTQEWGPATPAPEDWVSRWRKAIDAFHATLTEEDKRAMDAYLEERKR